LEKVFDAKYKKEALPHVLCIASIKNEKECVSIINTFLMQSYQHTSLLIIYPDGLENNFTEHRQISYINNNLKEYYVKNLKQIHNVSVFSTTDYYGENYLLDLVLALKYTHCKVISKSGYFTQHKDTYPTLEKKVNAYTYHNSTKVNASLFYIEDISTINFITYIQNIDKHIYHKNEVFAIDPFNYCKNGMLYGLSDNNKKMVDDLKNLNQGDIFDSKWGQEKLLPISIQKIFNFISNIYQIKIKCFFRNHI